MLYCDRKRSGFIVIVRKHETNGSVDLSKGPANIMESRQTVFDHVRVSTRRKTSDLKYLFIIA